MIVLGRAGPFETLYFDDGFREQHDRNADDCNEKNNDLNRVLTGVASITPHRVCFFLP